MTREFTGHRAETDDAVSVLPSVSQAALRQFSLERAVTGYGLDYADAMELGGRVLHGQDWHTEATALSDECLTRTEAALRTGGEPTRTAYLQRQVFGAFGAQRVFWGYGHPQAALHLARMRHDVHRTTALAHRPRPRTGHGPRRAEWTG